MNNQPPREPDTIDSITPDLTDEDRDWMRRHQGTTEHGKPVTLVSDPLNPTALHIMPDSRYYAACVRFVRDLERRNHEWRVNDALKRDLAWIWQLPDPFREWLIALTGDVASKSERYLSSRFGEVLYGILDNHLRAVIDPNAEQLDYSDTEMLTALQTPVPIGRVLLALSAEIGIEPSHWINDDDLTLLRQAS